MKVYKTEPNQFGWYWIIHITNGIRDIKIFKKCKNKNNRKGEESINIWGEGVELLVRVLEVEKAK